MKKKYFSLFLSYFILILFFIFLYAPIISLIIASFKQKGIGYVEMLDRTDLINGFVNSFYTAIISVAISLMIAISTLMFISIIKIDIFAKISYINLIIPEIILAISLLILFNKCNIDLGFKTLILSHSILSLSYIFLLLYYKYISIDNKILEAARDLGANLFISWKTIIFPLLKPSIIISSALAFILSFDDFIFSYFCSNPDFQTLPLVFLSILRAEPSPSLYAFSVSLLIICFIGLFIYYQFDNITNRDKNEK